MIGGTGGYGQSGVRKRCARRQTTSLAAGARQFSGEIRRFLGRHGLDVMLGGDRLFFGCEI